MRSIGRNFILKKTGYIDTSERGVWNITAKGQNASLTHQEALSVFREVQAGVKIEQANKITEDSDQESEELPTPEQGDHRAQLMEVLRNLSGFDFEKLCQRLLREAGFQQVSVTQKTRDGGIDGFGLLQINPFVSFLVLFQCKRYDGNSVTFSDVSKFRGAMDGRTDKGIIITTGTFTKDARKEANRNGVARIELVDGEKLLDIFEQLKFGLERVPAFEVKSDFFEQFRSK